LEYRLKHSFVALCLAALALSGCGGGGTLSSPASLSSSPPSITTQPSSVTVTAGAAASFSVTASGSTPLSYQWQISTDSGVTWASALGTATASSYTTAATTSTFNGYRYRVQISNGAGATTSDAATLTVTLPTSIERQVNATTTDGSITAAPSAGETPHVTVNPSPSVGQRGKLLVFLPGTQGRPGQYTYILRAGASRGFHAIGLNYPNQTAMGILCQTSSDPECYWNARNVVVFGGGIPVAGQSLVTKADSIVNRLEKLLAWMQTTYPAEGWGQFLLINGTVDWSKVILAGHSQGGGHAGVLAKSVALNRAVYFSSPEDWHENTDTPAGWPRNRANVTPADQQFGFGSDDDTLVPNAHAFTHWNNLGLPKPPTGPVSVDAASPPFANSRQLRTKQAFNPASPAVSLALKYHGVTVVDASTPLDASGKPLFDTNGVWAYLCFQ
jgi:hypothetical protein